jgi:hypothetical protein
MTKAVILLKIFVHLSVHLENNSVNFCENEEFLQQKLSHIQYTFSLFYGIELFKRGFSCSRIRCCANGQVVPHVNKNIVPSKCQEPLTP